MHRTAFRGLRFLGVVLAFTLAFQFLQPGNAFATGSLVLNPAAGTPGTAVSATGSGFQPGELITIFFSGYGIVATTFAVNSTGSFATQFNVPNVPPATYTVTATGATSRIAASAPFQVTSQVTTTSFALQKSVSVNGGPYSSTGTAVNGQGLTYALQYANTGTVAANNVVITDNLQPGQTFQSASAGCTAAITSGGLTTVTCTLPSVPARGSAGSSGIFFITTVVAAASSGTISNTAQISASNVTTPVQSNQTLVTVNGAAPGPFTVQKYVSDNGQAFTTSTTARQGDTLTYDIQFTNPVGAATATNVVVYDTLQPGQTLLGYPATSTSCTSYNNTTGVVTCPIGSVPGGTTVHVHISTVVNTNATGTISNQASVTVNGTGPFPSNTTIVQVFGTTPPPPVTGGSSFILCGTISVFSSTTVIIGGITVTTVVNVVITGSGSIGQNECSLFTFNGQGQATNLTFSPNLTGLGVICGYYQPTSFNTIYVSGVPINVAYPNSFQSSLVAGGYYCFLLTSTGTAYAALNGLPTSARALVHHHAAHARGRELPF